ncbi:MAG: DoxX family protein [Spirochaetia bacterium]|nr:DoxX family protein [Spirochaetia bacterium]
MTHWISLLFRVLAALVLGQTLFYKFSAAPESVFIFQTLGMEPIGRLGSGIAELLTVVLLLIPRTSWLGGIIGIGIMLGAVLSHIFVLGIAVMGDHGLLFCLALFTMFACAGVVFLERKRIPFLS